MNSGRITLVAILTIRRDHLADFRAFERHAARVMSRHGGAIERTVVIDDGDATEALKEIHIVTFPDMDHLTMYRNDPAMAEVAHLREQSVIGTEIMTGHDGPDYMAG